MFCILAARWHLLVIKKTVEFQTSRRNRCFIFWTNSINSIICGKISEFSWFCLVLCKKLESLNFCISGLFLKSNGTYVETTRKKLDACCDILENIQYYRTEKADCWIVDDACIIQQTFDGFVRYSKYNVIGLSITKRRWELFLNLRLMHKKLGSGKIFYQK